MTPKFAESIKAGIMRSLVSEKIYKILCPLSDCHYLM